MWYDLRGVTIKEEIMTGPRDQDIPDVSAGQVLDLTVETLQTHLNLSIEGLKCRNRSDV